MGLNFLSACLPKLILVASNWKLHPLIRNSSPQSRVFRCLPSLRDPNVQVSWVFSFRFYQSPSFYYCFSLSLIHSVTQKWLSLDSEIHVIQNLIKNEHPKLPIYRVHSYPTQNEVIGHLHSGRYFQRISTDMKRLRAIS